MNATQYLEHWQKNKVWTHLAWPKHQRRFDLCAAFARGVNMADVGCAYGHSTAELAKRVPAARWVGIDFDRAAVDIARRLFPAMTFVYAPAIEKLLLDTAPRRFDTVVCSEVIEHVEDDRGFVAGLLELAGQRLVVTTPDRRVSDPGHLRVYTEPALRELFGAGAEVHRDAPFFYVVVTRES